MSELGSIVDRLRVESLPQLSDASIEDAFLELSRWSEQLEVERLRRLAEIDRRKLYERDGHLSAASWVVTTLKVAWGNAREQVRMARGLVTMPKTREAVEAGDVSLSGARVLVAARETDPFAFKQSESELVEAARLHSVSGLGRVTSLWRDHVQGEQLTRGEDPLRARRRLDASVSFGGMVRIDGDLDPETGETLLTALRAVTDAEARSGATDDRTAAQRRADALGEICRWSLDRSDRRSIAGERPHLMITVRAAALSSSGKGMGSRGRRQIGRGHEDRRATAHARQAAGWEPAAELDHVGPVRIEVARRLGCDASVMRVIMAAPSEPLDVGRRTPLVPTGIRRALIARDRTCRFPGCDRPHAWCEAHHVVHWADGGPTALSNLVLLCRRHHRQVHERGRFSLEMQGGQPVFRRPDGSVLGETRAPP